MKTPTNPIWGLLVFAILASECGNLLAQGRTNDAAIVGIFLVPVLAWMVAYVYGYYRRRS